MSVIKDNLNSFFLPTTLSKYEERLVFLMSSGSFLSLLSLSLLVSDYR